jgi:hypothetical protein
MKEEKKILFHKFFYERDFGTTYLFIKKFLVLLIF